MKIKTSELTGAALDWAVAKCEGIQDSEFVRTHMDAWPYSTDWAQGGPIIEREKIDLNHYRLADKTAMWEASGSIGAKGAGYLYAVGPTPLIAAMRCYVASNLGAEVEIPNELIGA